MLHKQCFLFMRALRIIIAFLLSGKGWEVGGGGEGREGKFSCSLRLFRFREA